MKFSTNWASNKPAKKPEPVKEEAEDYDDDFAELDDMFT